MYELIKITPFQSSTTIGQGSSQYPPLSALGLCNKILEKLLSVEHSGYMWPFREAFAAKQRKLNSLGYKTTEEFADDVRLIFTNCHKYNNQEDDVVAMCRKVQDLFEMKYAEIFGEAEFEDGPPEDPPVFYEEFVETANHHMLGTISDIDSQVTIVINLQAKFVLIIQYYIIAVIYTSNNWTRLITVYAGRKVIRSTKVM